MAKRDNASFRQRPLDARQLWVSLRRRLVDLNQIIGCRTFCSRAITRTKSNSMVNAQSSDFNVRVPWFVAGPGQTDLLLIMMGIVLVLIIFTFGVLMLRLHHLPEHIAHKGQKVQYQVVATLGLLAMFTHYNLFWIVGLLLAMVDFPDFTGLLGRIASSVKRISLRRGQET